MTRFLKWTSIALGLLIALLAVAAFAVGFRSDIPIEELRPKYASAASRFVEVDGLNVHYRDQGPRDAPALVLLHGSSASLHTWEGWEARLKRDFRVISVDLPAHGLTGPLFEGGDYSLDGYARFLDRFADRISLNRFALAGNSMGGAIAWTYAARRPERVERLILIAAAGYPSERLQQFFGLLRFPGAEAMLRWMTPRFAVAAKVRWLYADPEKVDDALIDRYRDLLLRAGNRAAVVERLNALRPDPELLRKLEMPVLILWGAKDRLLLPAAAFRFQNDIPDAALQVYSDAGHMPMEEIPERSAADAAKFLRGR